MKKLIMFGLIAFISLSSVKSFASIESQTVAVETVSLSTTALLHPDDTACDKVWDMAYRLNREEGYSVKFSRLLADIAYHNCVATGGDDNDKPEQPKNRKTEIEIYH